VSDPRQRVIGCRDHGVRMDRERFGARGEFARRAAHDRQVDLVGTQQRHQLLAVAADRKLHFDRGVLLPELRQQAWHEVLGRADHADRHPARLQPPEPRDRVLRVLQGRENLARIDE